MDNDNDNDDFEFVDNDKAGFDDQSISDDDDQDDMIKISTLNKELKDVASLKKFLQNQSTEYNKLIKKLQNDHDEYNKLKINLKNELNDIKDIKIKLKNDQNELTNILNILTPDSANTLTNNIDKSNQIITKLNTFYNDTSLIQKEFDKLKQLRTQQQDIINQCKIYAEQLTSNQRDCLISLDKSVSFSCKDCNTDIALKKDIESKCYQVGQGSFTEKKRGYLFTNAVNMVLGTTKTENFTTGSYKIAWTSCAKCNAQMGWKYISADNTTNTNKVGKYCLARYSLSSPEDRAQLK